MPNDAKPVDGVREAVEKAQLIVAGAYGNGVHDGHPLTGITGRGDDDEQQEIAELIAALVAEVRLEDAKALCGKCECLQEPRQTNDGIWWHQHFYSHKDTECPAGPIHDLLKETEENE